jgi:polar amino acid transport system substrate-binding protein
MIDEIERGDEQNDIRVYRTVCRLLIVPSGVRSTCRPFLKRRGVDMRRLAYIFTVAFSLFSFSALSAEPLVISFNAANPPFMSEQGGKTVGIYPAIVEAVFNRMQVGIALEPKPWARVLLDLDNGIAGAGGVYLTAERAQKYDFSEPFYTENLRVYFHPSRPLIFKKVEDLQSRNIGVVRGRSYGESFDLARKAGLFAVDETGTDEQNFLKLDLARVDTAIAIEEPGNAHMKKLKNVQVAPTPLARNAVYLVFAKSAQKKALLTQFNQTLAAMRASGELDRVVAAELAR